MTESRVGFLHRIVSCLPQSDTNESLKVLRSFYSMRCKEFTLRYGLPIKPFSQKNRCPHCCLDWNKKTEVKINPIKLSSRQRQRIKSEKLTNASENKLNMRKAILQSNQMEQTCSFCKHTTVTTLPKPEKVYPKIVKNSFHNSKTKSCKQEAKKPIHKTVTNKNKNKHGRNNFEASKKSTSTNVYSNALEVFSLKNDQNTLASTIKAPQKIIKNNKKKKDKFAGLCQKAVLASAKQKESHKQDENKSKLSLFLKPSSG